MGSAHSIKIRKPLSTVIIGNRTSIRIGITTPGTVRTTRKEDQIRTPGTTITGKILEAHTETTTPESTTTTVTSGQLIDDLMLGEKDQADKDRCLIFVFELYYPFVDTHECMWKGVALCQRFLQS